MNRRVTDDMLNAPMPWRLEDLDAVTQAGLLTLGSTFAALRRDRIVTQRALAARVGTSQSTISRFESGKAPWLTARYLARMLVALNVGPARLKFIDPRPRWEVDPIVEFMERANRYTVPTPTPEKADGAREG
jgi:transcriptional regulator with XRE-family HTH domain